MTIKTICCQLIAPEQTRQRLWQYMAEQYTPLMTELIRQVGAHPDLSQWQDKGKMPSDIVKDLCTTLKKVPPFTGLPSNFYGSAINQVNYIFASWLASQHKLKLRLNGKSYYLSMLYSDQDLVKNSGHTLTQIRSQAQAILNQLSHKNKDERHKYLFQRHRDSSDILEKTAITYLIKHNHKIPTQPEQRDKFDKLYRKTEIQIERLEKQIEARLPKGRNLSDQQWLNTLITASQNVPKDEDKAKLWQKYLLTDSKSLPYPVSYETNENLVWSLDNQGRLNVRFNGLGKLTFKLYCDNRQLHYFQQFLQDQTIKKSGKNKHSSGLFLLRSAMLVWKPNESKGKSWNKNTLHLHCAIDTRLLTDEGTQEVRQEKLTQVSKIIESMEKKPSLNDNQKQCLKRKKTSQKNLHESFPRPSRAKYEGNPNIIVGVTLGLKHPVTVSVVDMTTQKVIAYRSTKQLLGKNYKLLNRYQVQKQRQAHQRHVNQRQSSSVSFGDSNQGKYLNDLLVGAVIDLATQYQAGSIFVPKLDHIREIVESEITVKAEKKIPLSVNLQKKYAKTYRMSVHQWGYGRSMVFKIKPRDFLYP